MLVSEDLFTWLKENTEFSPNEREDEFDSALILEEFGYDFPNDYYELMKKTDGCEFYGKVNGINLYNLNDLTYFHTEPDYMVPLSGMAIIGSDSGGNIYYYDPKNKIGRGAFAIYWTSRGDLSLRGSKFIGNNLQELAHQIKNADKDFFDFPDLTEEGYTVIDNPPVPKANINSMEELLKAIPKEINSARYGHGILEVKESTKANGSPHISGQYNLDDGMCLFYTFSSTYQGFYDAIAPAIAMEGLF